MPISVDSLCQKIIQSMTLSLLLIFLCFGCVRNSSVDTLVVCGGLDAI